MFIISVPKGRIFFFTINYLKKIKIYLNDFVFRKIILKTNRLNLFIIISKNKDLINLLNLNLINFGFIGSDYYNYKIKKKIIKKTNSLIYFNNNLKIVSKFFNIINFYNFKKKNIKFNGSIEFFLKKKYGILDITETNKTLYQNKLFPINFIFKIKILLIFNIVKKEIINFINKC